MAPASRVLNYDPDALPVNPSTPEGAIKVESPFFSGRVLIYVKDLPGAPAGVFDGQKRRSLVAVQARCILHAVLFYPMIWMYSLGFYFV